MSTQKEIGTDFFKKGDYPKAIEHYTKAIEENPSDHTVYGNRAAAYQNMRAYDQAKADAEKCIEIKPDWSKGYQRKAMALHSKGDRDEAIKFYELGVEKDPNNKQCADMLAKCKQEKEAPPQDKGAGMFGPEGMAKLAANPKIAGYMQDPKFMQTLMMCQQNPTMLLQMMQMDPRLMEVFQVLTGLDMSQMGGQFGGQQFGGQQQQQPTQPSPEEIAKAKEEAKKKAEEEERKRKEAEEAKMSDPERQALQKKKNAADAKLKGNDAYKKRDFPKALEFYNQAIELDPEELTYYTNKAAVFFEQKNYDSCIETCDEAIALTKGKPYDYVKLSKAMARKANAQAKQDKLVESIQTYKDALLENNDGNIKDAMKRVEKLYKEQQAKAYIDPAKAEEHKEAGVALFKKGDFPGAIKEFEEGLRRDPKSKAIFANRAATFLKLMEPNQALKDCEKALEIDPTFVKVWARKATCHHMMKEYHKAIKACDDGLKVDPSNKELLESKQKTMMAIQMNAHASSGNDEERMRHAMADPEIQQLMRDPRIQQVLRDMQENPASAQGAMNDPFIAESINKLIQAGVLKMA